ncbi:hypothetical protein [Streptomyces sp. NPDC007172]|uniref:hypothetical protein n=1 Tax=Streptomyces sp. NPDC007172 TaxID=3364776 RepID=UPI0036AB6B22
MRVGEVVAVVGSKVTLANGPFQWEQEKYQCRPASTPERASLAPSTVVRIISGECG